MVRDIPNGVFTLTMHPQVIGRGHRILMLERLIAHFRESGAQFTTLSAAAEAFRGRAERGDGKEEMDADGAT
jgi:peptidoglycan/xylan/chitin deacetylase (PgdA/CDA1 family)